MWEHWDRVRCPTLLLRGAESDLLPASTALAMARRGPRPRLVEFAGVGHAPALASEGQIAPILDFLAGGRGPRRPSPDRHADRAP